MNSTKSDTPTVDDSKDSESKELEQVILAIETLQISPLPKGQMFETYCVKGLASMIKSGKRKILVMTGAGISTAADIPDFRSPKTGLYSNLQKYNLPSPESVFTLKFFKKNPVPFCMLAKEMWPSNFQPTPVHYFIKMLSDKGLLLRNYTQNIDTLERLTGMNQDHLVEAHGAFEAGHCVDCQHEHTHEYVKTSIFKDQVPKCLKCKGLVKPKIVFFGEDLPGRYHELLERDKNNADLLIVIGTSLVVHPFASIVDVVGKDIPRVLINMHSVKGFSSKKKKRDMELLGDCQVAIMDLAKELGWYDELVQFAPNSKSFKEAIENHEKVNKSNL